MSGTVEPAGAEEDLRLHRDGPLPRVGFLGLGWIGRERMRALRDSAAAEIVALADPDEDACRAAQLEVPDAKALSEPLSWPSATLMGS